MNDQVHGQAYDAAKSALVARLEDFLVYLTVTSDEEAAEHVISGGVDVTNEDRFRFALEYVNQAIEHEDTDPIEAIMYAQAVEEVDAD